MNWLDQQPIEMLRAAITHSPCCILFSLTDGKMLWGNDAFLEWIGYTQTELQQRTWMEISVNDSSLSADLEAASRIADGYLVTYKVQKQYVPKNSRPKWGTLYVLRYPPVGETKVCICVWEPMRSDDADSFALTKASVGKMESEFREVREMLEAANVESLPQKAIVIAVELAMAYPKVAIATFMFCCILVGGNTFLDVLKNVRALMSPVP